ncbi:sulfotransferase family protein [Thiocapsa marina]|uniref:Sulfotransferase n=1 Tax=Thiocapsa marina 5811 TaxID=768671 RepID=F9UAR2_9GAMM|nr:sulfotransferase [Thiocapsa marina]EGV18530.1 sulfotransferase [Thiocapsa marina 5811]
MRKVDFFIVGAPKCGTTAMYSYLRSHPSVFFPERKEPHYFGTDLDFHGQPRITQEDYLDLFTGARPDQKLGDASVFYLMSENAAEEIRDYNPNARIVVMLRNPVDVMHSFHSQRLFNGTEEIESFAEALAAQSDRRMGMRLPARIGLRQGLFYHDLVDFAPQVQRYLDSFGHESVKIVLYDDFVNDLPSIYSELCTFLDIDTTYRPAFEAINVNKVVRSRWLRDFLKDKPDAVARAVRVLVPSSSLRKRLRDTANGMNSVTKPRSPIDPLLRAQLLDELAPSIARLESLLGRPLPSWHGDPAPKTPNVDASPTVI